jgi:hypothetical protein
MPCIFSTKQPVQAGYTHKRAMAGLSLFGSAISDKFDYSVQRTNRHSAVSGDWRRKMRRADLLVFLSNQHIAPVIHLGFDELGVITLQFQFQIAFFQLENVFAHVASLSYSPENRSLLIEPRFIIIRPIHFRGNGFVRTQDFKAELAPWFP